MSTTDRSPHWRIGLAVAGVAATVRLIWVLCVPTIVVGDFATYRESAMYLSEHGRLDDGFIYMPGVVLLLAAIYRLGGEVLASKMLGVVCGGIAAGALYVATAGLADSTRPADPNPGQPPIPQHRSGDPGGRSNERLPMAAWLVALLFGLWLPGIATASVVGTDVPCAAMMCVAMACLFQWGRARPRTAAMAFGAAMGGAAYFRAVALALVLFSVGYWVALRVPARQVLARAGLAGAVTLLVLMPWAIRNREATGSLSFTDSHGGITALMGNDPNTEGTYSRALFGRFHALTGRTFLSLPHVDTDRAAYDIARDWIAFQPAWTAGMIALRLGRLLAPERGLLYWSVYRPGILPETATLWFNNQRAWVTGIVDGYAWILVLGLCAGVAFAVVDRHFVVLVPVLLGLALLATYALFVAEPRYRLTSEIVAFPTVAWGWSRLVGVLRAACTASRDGRQRWPRPALLGFGATALTLGVVLVGGWSIVTGGRHLRERHRWAVSVSMVEGHAQQTFWRTSPDRSGPSMVEGATDGVIIRAERRTSGASEGGETIVEMILPAGLDREMRNGVPVTSEAAPLSQTFRMRVAWSPTEVGGQGCATLELRAPAVRSPFAVSGRGDTELAGTVSPELLRDPRRSGRALVMVRLLADAALGGQRSVCSVRLSQVEISPTPP